MRYFLVVFSMMAAMAGTPELWPAKWISHPEAGRELGVYHFRKTITLDAKPATFRVHVTADNRYELFVNGTRAAMGPSRGDLQHWRYATVDLAPYLRAGRNTLAAVVWNWGRRAPAAQFSNETGFLIQGEAKTESAVNTPEGWKCLKDAAYAVRTPGRAGLPIGALAGAGESMRGELYPWGWEKPEFDDSKWVPAVQISNAVPYGLNNDVDRWFLVPDRLPQMEDREVRPRGVVRAQGGTLPGRIPPHSKATVLVDNGVLTTAYPELTVSGGRGASIEMTYSEAPYTPREGVRPRNWPKGNRDDIQGKVILGLADAFYPDGGARRTYRPLWWRTYRYLEFQIETGEEALTLDDFKGRFTGYPFAEAARVEAPDPDLAKIWEVGWRTARLCAHETYMDCPYFEQMQYVGDTRVQALISLYVSGDDRLMRNAIEQFDQSRSSEGITYSRYPSNVPQYIPTFSLLWVGMIHDYWMHRRDDAFIGSQLPGIRTVLSWFEQRRDASGLAGAITWWPFVDWASAWKNGVPPGGGTGQSAVVSLQWLEALEAAADLEQQYGEKIYAERYRREAGALRVKIRETCWDGARGLFADTPEKRTYSRHVNILAVLEDLLPPAEQRQLMGKVLSDTTLTDTTYYFRHYLSRAINKAGLGDRYVEQLAPYREMLKQGMTTWPETPGDSRSDCHAWSSSPNYELLATVAGIEPAEPGFRSVRVRPHLGPLPWLRARMPHPQGVIEVDFVRRGAEITGTVTLPPGVEGVFKHGGKRVKLRAGKNTIE
jgi:alpha-L-rhamnosidase